MSARPSITAIADFFARNPFFHYEPTQGLVPLHQSHHPRRLLRAPNQCLAAETWVDGPDGGFRIGDVAEGEWVRVYALTADGVQPAIAVKNPTRPPEPLYRVTTSLGRSFVATARHRVLDAARAWRPVQSLTPDLPLWGDDAVRAVRPERIDAHHDLHVPTYNNFLVDGLVHHNCGKTWAGAWEAWAHLLGTEAWRRFVPWHPAHVLEVAYPAASGLILVADLDNTYPVICEKLHGTEPTSWLDPATRYIPGKGYYTNGSRFIRTKDGKTIIFRSGEGSPLSVESASVGWVWIDEPPKETHFGGALSRVAVAQGPAWMTFTSVARPTAYLRRHVEGDPETGEGPREDWLQIRPSLTEADCTTISGRVIRSTASIAAQTAAYGPWEYAQRVYGEWEGISVERRLKGFSEACLWDGRLDYDPAAGDELRLSMDHGEGAGKQVAYLSLIRRPKRRAPSAYLLREWSGRENTTPRQVAQGLLDLLGSVGASIHHVKRIVGDVNSAGLAGGGHRYNELVEAELADLLGVSELPIHIQIPFKGKGSVDAGESAISFAAKEGRFYVFSRDGHPYSCRAFIHAARHYTGREKDLKDPIDGVRYGIADVLLASYAANREPQQVLTL